MPFYLFSSSGIDFILALLCRRQSPGACGQGLYSGGGFY